MRHCPPPASTLLFVLLVLLAFSPFSGFPSCSAAFSKLPTLPNPTRSPEALTGPPSLPTFRAGANVTSVTNFTYSTKGDGLCCLSTDSTHTTAYAVSLLGEVFSWSLTARPSTVQPLYSVTKGTQTEIVEDCEVDADAALLYFVDPRGQTLWAFNLSTPDTAPYAVATFPSAPTPALTSVALNSAAHVAYVGTQVVQTLFAVELRNSSNVAEYAVGQDVTALALSPDGRTLYFATPAGPYDQQGSISSMPVDAAGVLDSGNVTVLYSSLDVEWVTSIAFLDASTLLFTDGGPLHARQCEDTLYPETIRGLNTAGGNVTTLLTTDRNLVSRVVVGANGTQLQFVTAWCEGRGYDYLDTLAQLDLPKPPLSAPHLPSPSPSPRRASTATRK